MIDALVAHGDAAAIAPRLTAHLDAGADHVAIQVLPMAGDPAAGAARAGLGAEHRRLTAALLRRGVQQRQRVDEGCQFGHPSRLGERTLEGRVVDRPRLLE